METTLRNVDISEKSRFLSAVFLYVFIFMAITAGVCAAISVIFNNIFHIVPYLAGETVPDEFFALEGVKVYLGLLIGSALFMFVLMIWIMIVSFRQKGNLIVPFTLYAITMGVLLSACTMFVDWQTVAISLGITCLAFGVMFVIGYFTKVNTNILWMIVTGIFIGALLISLFNIIWMLFFPGFQTIYWLVSYAIFFAMMLVTIIDVANMRRIAESGEGTRNLALFCAFRLYVDFIYMFIRILAIVARFSGRK